MDNTPVSLLGAIEALDWFFVPGCDIWMTDMVIAEATREPDQGKDPRRRVRAYIADWVRRNRHRIKVQVTDEGRRYEAAMELWRLAGSPPHLRPNGRDFGESSVISVVRTARHLIARDETIIAVVDNRDARDALRAIRADIDLMGTQAFVRWIAEDFQVQAAETAWDSIILAHGGKADPGETEEVVYIRRR